MDHQYTANSLFPETLRAINHQVEKCNFIKDIK